jgi:hypothetical protein
MVKLPNRLRVADDRDKARQVWDFSFWIYVLLDVGEVEELVVGTNLVFEPFFIFFAGFSQLFAVFKEV